MMNKRKFSFSAALLLAAALIGSGCQQQQKPADPAPDPKPAPAPDNKQPPNGTTLLPVTVNFEGTIVDVAEDGVKTDYFVTVSLSHNKVGATAETIEQGFFYIGKSNYDAESGAIDVSLADTRSMREPINLTGTYQKATDTLVITEFAGRERKAILTRVVKASEQRTGRYHTMVKLVEPLGTSYLSLIINGQNVTAVLVTGQTSASGTVSTARAYNGTGYIRRGRELFVEIPLDTKREKTVEVRADVKNGEVSNLTVYVAGNQYQTHEQHTGQNAPLYSQLPLYRPVRFTLNTQQSLLKEIPNGNRKAYLTLEAVPLVKTPGGTGVEPLNKNNHGYEPYGYRMYAQFTSVGGEGVSAFNVTSKRTYVDVTYASPVPTATTSGYTPGTSDTKKGKYKFFFTKTSFTNNGSFTDNLEFMIENWRPVADGTEPETVTAGNYTFSLSATAANSQGKIVSAGGTAAAAVELKDFFGSAVREPLTTAPQDGEVYAKLDGSTPGTPRGESTAIAAGDQKKAKYIFAEGFVQINAARP